MSDSDPERLELPSGDVVTPEDVFLYDDYPYRYVPVEGDYEFELEPLYWGGGDMNVPFEDASDLEAQWSSQSRGLLSEDEWEAWLRAARQDDRYESDELDAIEAELPVETGGILASIRRNLGL